MNELSRKRLATCHVKLQELFNEVDQHYPLIILEGHRGMEAQNKAFAEGKSKLQWPFGNHNSMPSLAVDVSPFPYDPKDTKKLFHFVGFVLGIAKALEINVRNGFDWDQDLDFNDQTFNDGWHFELTGDT